MTMGDREDTGFSLDRTLVRRSFDAACDSYDAAAVLQREVRGRLHGRLDYVRLAPRRVLDLGAGTGHGARALKQRYHAAQVIALDLARGMAAAARRQRSLLRRFDVVCADAVALPLADASVDLIVSNLMLQWCDDPERVFAEAARILQPGGLLTFTTFGPDTLKELREAWAAADSRTHVNQFIDMHDLGDALLRAGLAEPVLDVEYFTLTYADTRALMNDLKAIGAHNVTRGRAPGLTGKRRFATMQAAYESRRRDGRLPATYEVVYGQAWAPRDRRRKTSSTEATIPLGQIGRRGSRR
jgi:malonyl-CoA O-methyltransferase